MSEKAEEHNKIRIRTNSSLRESVPWFPPEADLRHEAAEIYVYIEAIRKGIFG